jgi:meso-butanediol dehydrogenase/(S,S)-butanediol dehydrogenase/diacetyl reductase
MKLDGKVALITGGGSGIGASIAKRFVTDGAKVCITGRRKEVLDKMVASLPAGSAVACVGDVTKHEDVKRMVETTVKFGGKINVLVNNAGFDPPGTVVDIDPKLWQQIVDTNLTGPFLLMKESIPLMIKAGGGSIINIASLAGVRCIPAMPAYCSSKAGVIMLAKQAALDYGPKNIRCNSVLPGACRTEMLEHAMAGLAQVLKTDLDNAFKYFASYTPLKRVSKPDEIAGICSYLASDDSAFVTGTEILIDGGAAIVDPNGTAVSNAGIAWGDK